MLKYLIIPLADNAVSFCNYEQRNDSTALIELDTLKKALVWAMKENLNIQFLYPDSEIPTEYHKVIDSVDHTSIVSSTCEDGLLADSADVVVFDSWASITYFRFQKEKSYIIRTTKNDFFENSRFLGDILKAVDRLVVVITDIHSFTEEDFTGYVKVLDSLIPVIVAEYKNEHYIHFNLLTDRILLEKMNNCNAGFESITLAPNGEFYICPAFYFSGDKSVGNPESGLTIKNPQLYRLDHAPICRICDAYQCRRCVWLNKKITLEVNTPSHEQCVVAHIERNASKTLSERLHKEEILVSQNEISTIEYLDPFDNLKNL